MMAIKIYLYQLFPSFYLLLLSSFPSLSHKIYRPVTDFTIPEVIKLICNLAMNSYQSIKNKVPVNFISDNFILLVSIQESRLKKYRTAYVKQLKKLGMLEKRTDNVSYPQMPVGWLPIKKRLKHLGSRGQGEDEGQELQM